MDRSTSARGRGPTTERKGAPRTEKLDGSVEAPPAARGVEAALVDDAWLAMVAADPALYLKDADDGTDLRGP